MTHPKSLFLVLGLILLNCQGRSQNHDNILPSFSKASLVEDLNQYKEAMETHHPGLYWYQTKTHWDSLFQNAIDLMEDQTDLISFYKIILRINESIHCGHTRVSLDRNFVDSWSHNVKVIPYDIRVSDGRLVIDHTLTDNNPFTQGDVITKINGHQSSDISETLLPLIAMDGFNQSGKWKFLERRLPLQFSFFFPSQAESFEIEIERNGNLHEASITGIPFQSWIQESSSGDEELLSFTKN